MDRHSRQSKGTKWKCTDTPDSRRGQSGNGQTFQTVEGDKWKWTDTPDSRRGQSGNGQTLQTVEGDKVEMDRHSVAMELCSRNELKVQIYKGQ